MEKELELLEKQLKDEISLLRQKYNLLKKEVRNKYKTKRVLIPKTVKDKLWDTYFGKTAGIGKCYCCQEEINSKKFECGHIISVSKGGTNNFNNLKPICGTCNKSMGTENLEEFKKKFFEDNSENSKYNIDNLKINNDIEAKHVSSNVKILKCRYCNKTFKECNEINNNNINEQKINNLIRNERFSNNKKIYNICQGFKLRTGRYLY